MRVKILMRYSKGDYTRGGNIKIKNIFKRSLITLMVILLSGSMVGAVNDSQSKTTNGLLYIMVTSTTSELAKPFYSTQALHTQNYSTTIFVNQSLYTSVTASGSITAGYSTFAELSVTIGIAATQGYTLQTGVSYTIPSYVPSGRYRITSKYPGSTVGLSIWNNEPSRIFNSNVAYAPDKDTAYRALERYANP